MRAAVHEEFGGVEVLKIVKVPDPRPGPGEVLIAVKASALNRLDVLQRRGPPLVPGFSLPHIAGMDMAGEILEIGSGVDLVGVGDRVLVNPSLHCGRCLFCMRGEDGFCSEMKVLGGNCPGGHAELCVVPATHLYRIPQGITLTEAATIPTSYSTSWLALISAGKLRAGETIMIHAAGSGVSTAAIQLAKRFGAIVVATAGSERKLATAMRLGADFAIDNRREDLVKAALEITDGIGVDLVFDHVGPALFDDSLRVLRPQGRLILCGTTTGAKAVFSLPQIYQFGLQILGAGRYSQREFESMLDFYWDAGFEPVIDSEMPLENICEAHRKMEANEVIGKIIIRPIA